jgi:natural product precursor
MKMLDTIMEGTSMSKWEMSNLLGGDNINSADYCACTGGTTSDNINEYKGCKCSNKMVSYARVF